MSADGAYVSVGGDSNYDGNGQKDNQLYLFGSNSSTPLWNYDVNYDIQSIAISADGEYIVAGSEYSIYLFNTDSNTPLWTYSPGGGINSYSVDISSDGEFIVAVDGDKVKLFDKDSNSPVRSFACNQYVPKIEISQDGEYFAVTSYGGSGDIEYQTCFYDKDTSTALWKYSGSSATTSLMWDVSVSADGKCLLH